MASIAIILRFYNEKEQRSNYTGIACVCYDMSKLYRRITPHFLYGSIFFSSSSLSLLLL